MWTDENAKTVIPRRERVENNVHFLLSSFPGKKRNEYSERNSIKSKEKKIYKNKPGEQTAGVLPSSRFRSGERGQREWEMANIIFVCVYRRSFCDIISRHKPCAPCIIKLRLAAFPENSRRVGKRVNKRSVLECPDVNLKFCPVVAAPGINNAAVPEELYPQFTSSSSSPPRVPAATFVGTKLFWFYTYVFIIFMLSEYDMHVQQTRRPPVPFNVGNRLIRREHRLSKLKEYKRQMFWATRFDLCG